MLDLKSLKEGGLWRRRSHPTEVKFVLRQPAKVVKESDIVNTPTRNIAIQHGWELDQGEILQIITTDSISTWFPTHEDLLADDWYKVD